MSMLFKPKSEHVRKIFDVNVEPTKEFADKMDSIDPLKIFRYEFEIPHGLKSSQKRESIYLCGNSLGLLPKRTRNYMNEELNKWSNIGVEGHFIGKRPWAIIDERPCKLMIDILGAQTSNEIAIMNSLSVNNNLMMISFYRPTKSRYKILIEGQAFCSDHHTIRSQIELHGLNVNDCLIELYPRNNEHILRIEDILSTIDKHGNSISLVWLGAIQYYSGQYFDIPRITKKAHEYGCYVGYDLAHATGNVPLKLHDWDVDFATFCTYKYLNSGAGSIAGIFVHNKHDNKSFKILKGWWGQEYKERFKMESIHNTKKGAQGWQISNPAIFPMICLEASLEIFNEAGIHNLRYKSICLTNYLECLIKKYLNNYITIITPNNYKERGAQLSLIFNINVEKIHEMITNNGIICDVRRPNVMRIAPTPLYNTFNDIWEFIQILKHSLMLCLSKL